MSRHVAEFALELDFPVEETRKHKVLGVFVLQTMSLILNKACYE